MTGADDNYTATLERMFDDFRAQSEAVVRAYESLQEDSRKVKYELERKTLELERKNAELEKSLADREALEREVLQAKTMAALGEMSAVVAHEIRNPLGTMGAWAGLLEMDLDADDPRRETLGKITDALAKLNKIVSNLLVYTRPISVDFRSVRLDALLEEIVDFTEIEIERLGRNVTVEKKFDCNGDYAYYIKADPEKMHQAIINLCLNAVQAMGEGGVLRVGLERISGEDVGGGSASGGCAADAGKDYAVFHIDDTGSGINDKDIVKIFDPFFTTKVDGTGLGLAIVRKIIEFHHGIIKIKSEVGKGTRVSCFLPISEGK